MSDHEDLGSDGFPEDMPDEIKEMLRRISGGDGDPETGMVFMGTPEQLFEKLGDLMKSDPEEDNIRKYNLAWNQAWEPRVINRGDEFGATNMITPSCKAMQPGDFFYTHGGGDDEPFCGWLMDPAESKAPADYQQQATEKGYVCTKALTKGETEAEERWLFLPAMYQLTPEEFAQAKVWMELGWPTKLPDWLSVKYDEREEELAEMLGPEMARRRPCDSCGVRWGSEILLSERYHRMGVPLIQNGETIVYNPSLMSPADLIEEISTPVDYEQRAMYFCRACGFEREIDLSEEPIFVQAD